MKRIAILFALLLPLTLPAQRLRLNAGDWESAGSAAFTSGELSGDLRLGVFIQDYLQVGVKLDYYDIDQATRVGAGLYVIQMFETRMYVLPYVGAGLGYGSLDVDGAESDTGVEFTLLAGLKYYLADNISLNTELWYGVSSGDTYVSGLDIDSSETGIRFGISYYW